jgi:hypothetical protein
VLYAPRFAEGLSFHDASLARRDVFTPSGGSNRPYGRSRCPRPA